MYQIKVTLALNKNEQSNVEPTTNNGCRRNNKERQAVAAEMERGVIIEAECQLDFPISPANYLSYTERGPRNREWKGYPNR